MPPKLGAVPDLRSDAFALTSEKPLGPKVYDGDGDAVVVALRERRPADLAKLDDATKDSLRTSLLQQKQQEALQAFMNDMKKRAQDATRADGASRRHPREPGLTPPFRSSSRAIGRSGVCCSTASRPRRPSCGRSARPSPPPASPSTRSDWRDTGPRRTTWRAPGGATGWPPRRRAWKRCGPRRPGSRSSACLSATLLGLLLAARLGTDVEALVCAGTPLRLSDRRTPLLRSLRWVPPLRQRFAVLQKRGRDISDPVARAASTTYDVIPLPALLSLLELRRLVRRELPRVTQPALILHGRHDHNAPPSNIELLRRRLGSRSIEAHVLERSWHVITEDVERDLVARLTIDFLARLETR